MSRRIATTLIALLLLVASLPLVLSDRNVSAQNSPSKRTGSPEPQLAFRPIAAVGLNGTTISRSKVPGGWLVTGKTSLQNNAGFGITFVPDPEHTWDGSSLR